MSTMYLTTEEVSRRLSLSVWTVRDYCAQGKLKSARIGKRYRVSEAHLEAFLSAAEEPVAVEQPVATRRAGRWAPRY